MQKKKTGANDGKRLFIFTLALLVVIAVLITAIVSAASNNAKKAKIVSIATYSPTLTPDATRADEPDFTPSGAASANQTPLHPSDANTVSVNIKAVGDIAIQTEVLAGAYNSSSGDYDFTRLFSKISGSLASDFTIASFETVCVDTSLAAYNGRNTYNTPASIIPAMKAAGINAVTLANSHILDQGVKGISQTTDKLKEAGISYFGAYNSQDEADAEKISLIDVKGIKLAVLSYTYEVRSNFASLTTAQKNYAVNLINESTIIADIGRAKTKGADVVIVALHWGDLFTNEPSSTMRSLAENLLIAGADVLLGSHTQEVQRITTKTVTRSDGTEAQGIVAYCLGNFVSEYRDPLQDSGIILSINIEKDLTTGKVTVGFPTYEPTWINKTSENGANVFEVLKIRDYYDTPGTMASANHTRMKKAWDEITGIISPNMAKLSDAE